METKHEEMAHDEKYAGYAPETADETGKYYDVDGASYKSDSYDEVKFSGTEKELYSFYDRFYESKQNN